MQYERTPVKTEITAQAVRGTPAIGGTLWAALTLNEWVAIATGVYILVQIAYLARKWWREEKDYKRGRR